MLDTKDIDIMLKELDESDNQRELLIKQTRDVVKSSKQLIYAVHRGEQASAKAVLAEIEKQYKSLTAIAAKNPELSFNGSFKVAAQEYTEAVCYYWFFTEGTVPPHTTIGVSSQHYLLGLCDLTGELVRKAINDVIKGNNDTVGKIKQVVEEIYWALLRFDFRDGEMRKKVDQIKYDMRRLEDLALDLKLKR